MLMKPWNRYAMMEDNVASLLQESIYRPCKLELCVPLWTYDTMPTPSRYNCLRTLIRPRMVMHDTMTWIRSIRCMTTHKEKHIKHNGIIGFLAKLGHTWPILTLAHKTVKWSKQHGLQT